MNQINKFVNVKGVPYREGADLPILVREETSVTVGSLKFFLEHQTQIPAGNQILLRSHSEAPLIDDSATLATLNHPWHDSPVMDIWLCTKLVGRPLMLQVQVIFAKTQIDTFMIEVESFATVELLQMKIDEEIGVPPGRQLLELCVELPLTESCIAAISNLPCRLSDVIPACNVDAGICQVFLREKSRRNISHLPVVMPAEERQLGAISQTCFAVDVGVDTVNTLKAKIRKRFEHRTSSRKFTLHAAGQLGRVHLADGAALLSRYGIGSGDTLISVVFLN